MLVHGGPGSGKTTIAIIKADLFVAEHLRPGQKVLFLSFARATVTRVLEALTEHSTNITQTRKNVIVDTYHAFFWRILKTHGYLLGLPRKLELLTPAGQAVALSDIRHEFGPVKKLTADKVQERRFRVEEKLRRLAFEEGKVCFDLFADLAADTLTRSVKIRALISAAYPTVILDEFQDTNLGQWHVVQQLGAGSSLIALADEEQRIYDFIGADPERLNQFRAQFAPKEIDLGKENHRSGDTDIAQFGNDVLKGKFREKYKYDGVKIFAYPPNENQALAVLKGQTLQALKRLIASQRKNWSLAILVPTKKMMRQASDFFHSKQEAMPAVGHHAAFDMEGAILAAEIIAFLLQPHTDAWDVGGLVELLCNYYRGRGGDNPSATDIKRSGAIRKAFDKAIDCRKKGKELPTNSTMRAIIAGYERAVAHALTGNPDEDWMAIRAELCGCGCTHLEEVAEEARNVRLLDRGTQLREALSLDWRDNGWYANALSIVRQAFMREHFATATRPESGIVVMNMHKAKGKQFDEVIIFEGWPRVVKGKMVANLDRIVRENSSAGDLTQARYNLRVSVTRAKIQTTILTPKSDPCVLLLRDKS